MGVTGVGFWGPLSPSQAGGGGVCNEDKGDGDWSPITAGLGRDKWDKAFCVSVCVCVLVCFSLL